VDQNQRSDERDHPIASDPSPAPLADSGGSEPLTPDAEASEPSSRSRWGQVRRIVRGVVWAFALVFAVALVTLFSIDLGPSLRGLAERQAGGFLKRDFRIGRLSARLLTGDFVLEDVRIGGLSPADRPFFTARRIVVDVPWWSIVTRELVVEGVEVRDWRMVVETWPDGRHNFPKFTRESRSTGPRRFVTTVRVVRAVGGTFTLDDHGAPWGITAPNLDVVITRADTYRGTAAFDQATIRIAKFEPMWARMKSRFKIEGGKVVFDRIDLTTDGATSAVTGETDLTRWPEQIYSVKSTVDFPRMKEIFFARDRFRLAGTGQFAGTFHLFKGGRELRGRFASLEARLNDWRFPALEGSLLWVRDRFEVTHASAGFYGGRTQFEYSMKPLGDPARPGIARFDVRYDSVSLPTLTRAVSLRGLDLDGRMSGRHLLEWPLGRFRDRRGHGDLRVAAPSALQGRTLSEVAAPGPRLSADDLEPKAESPAPVPIFATPIGAALSYTYGPEWIDLAPGWVATSDTYIELEGRTAYGDRSEMPFHVTSADWQESDRLLAGVMTAFGNPTRPITIGGAGTFDGIMRGAFRRPQIDGRFTGEHVRAWDVDWGEASAVVHIENAYADVATAKLTSGASTIDVDGRFSLGFPRRDGGEEINARVRVSGRPLPDLRHAFELDDYPVDGVLSGEFRVNGRYQGPYGFGRMTVVGGRAYAEGFETASANLRFEGNGVRLDGIEMAKSTGRLTGAAFVGWDGTYSFNADARRIPVEAIDAMAWPDMPFAGFVDFSASGSGDFDDPRYDVRGRIVDFYVRDEGIGQVSGRLAVRGDVLSIAQLEVASPRLAVSGAGRVTFTPGRDADLTLRFTNSSLDPYVRLMEPRFSPLTTATASGTLRIVGPLREPARVKAEGVIEELDLGLIDYHLRNDGPIRVAMAEDVARIEQLKLLGEGTTLTLAGEVAVAADRMRVRATGDASLGLLQAFFPDVRSSGQAQVQAELSGPVRGPVIVGTASITNGRLRYFGLPHSIDAVNGRVEFDASGARLVDGLSGRMGGGEVRFGGRIGVRDGTIESYALTAVGRDMRLRYPEGFRSHVDADLSLRGPVHSPVLSGSVLVKDALWIKPIDTEGADILGLAAAGGGAATLPAQQTASTLPMRFDVRIQAPAALRIDSPTARLVSSAELTLRGTYDRPALLGRAEINRGELLLEGNRYLVTRGSIEFANPARIDPIFDVEAETRARVPGQTYRVTFRASGTRDRFVWDLSSDPPLSRVDILALLFGDLRDPRDAELSALRLRDRTEEELLVARATRMLANPISSEVGKVVRKTFGVDSVQITPSLGDLSNLQSARLNPTARLTIGKRISDRVFLTYAQPLTSARAEQLVLIEYLQSDRLAWIVSRNEDDTYALDVRVRHVF
jgi:TamB, inner membrane protein subunit of TAM complex